MARMRDPSVLPPEGPGVPDWGVAPFFWAPDGVALAPTRRRNCSLFMATPLCDGLGLEVSGKRALAVVCGRRKMLEWLQRTDVG